MPTLSPRSIRPFSGFSTEIDDLFARAFGDPSPGRRGWTDAGDRAFTPAIESFLRDDRIVVRVDLPGIDPKAVDLTLDRNRLTITGERKNVHVAADGSQGPSPRTYREVRYGRFERTLALPPGVDPDSVAATYTDGVLEVTMQAPRELVSRKVPITVH